GYIGNRGGPQVFPIGENGAVFDFTRWENHRKATSKQNGYSRTISSRIHKMGCEDTYIMDKKGNRKNNQDYAATLTGGGNSGGNHSDMDLIKVPEATKKGYAEAKINNPLKNNTNKGWHFEQNVYDSKSILRSLKSTQGSGNKPKVIIPEATKKGYAEAEEGDSINLSVPNSKTRRGRVGKGEAQTLDTGMQQYTIQPKKIEIIGNLKGKDGHECHNVHSAEGIAPAVRENHGKTTMVEAKTQIRRLTPVECMRLQGFSDDHNKYGVMDGKVVEMSDTQRYKQAGNAVTVDVVQAVATIIKEKELT
ncbi:MAG: hypothetical protein CMC15_17850, partial [Flavobacteriaceae bacterium]|nr:hypothetical protein [Flavobacteriaceae bacterium]